LTETHEKTAQGTPTIAGLELVPDPENLPVRHVTGVASIILNGQTIAMTFVTDRTALRIDGTFKNDLAIAAKLRFDLNVATRIRDQLNTHISGLTTPSPPDDKPN
jgi:hypothetical protein